jgi:hypothetical protein
MAAMSTYLQSKINDHVLKNTAYTAASTVYCSLHSTTSSASAAGTELTDASYARQAITFGSAASGVSRNSGALTWAALAGAASVASVCIFDALTSGNLLYYDNLSAALPYTTGQTPTIADQALTVQAT